MATHERRFAGRDNAGLRAAIRERVAAWRAGERTERTAGDAIRGLARTIALTASGRATLDEVARDYEGHWTRAEVDSGTLCAACGAALDGRDVFASHRVEGVYCDRTCEATNAEE